MNAKHEKGLVTVYKAQGKLDGEMIKGFLQAQGIETFLDQDALGSIYGLTIGDLGEVSVSVREADEALARELLTAMENGEFADEILVGSQNSASADNLEDEIMDNRKWVLFLCAGNFCRL